MIIAGSSLRISISIDEDIGSSGTASISFLNRISTGSWPATVSDTATGEAYYDASPVDMSVDGTWTVWATYVFTDGRTLKTPAKQFTVYVEGTVQR